MMHSIVLLMIGFAIGLWLASSSGTRSGGGYQPREKRGINARPRPPGMPKPPECQYIMRGLRLPWSRYPSWLWNNYWKVSELPDTKWANEIKENIAKTNDATRIIG
jgi:hypothetical protein